MNTYECMYILQTNLSDEEADVAIRLSTEALGLPPGGVRIARALENQTSAPELTGDLLTARIRANSCAMCILEPGEE